MKRNGAGNAMEWNDPETDEIKSALAVEPTDSLWKVTVICSGSGQKEKRSFPVNFEGRGVD
jgi:hypothetical protein